MVRSDMMVLPQLSSKTAKFEAIRHLRPAWLNPAQAASKMRRRMTVTTQERWQSG
jgi:hypothetical protein